MSWAISVEPVVMYQARCAEIDCIWSPEPSWHESEARELAETHWREHDVRWRQEQAEWMTAEAAAQETAAVERISHEDVGA